MKKQETKIEGVIQECLRNAQFLVDIGNGKVVRAYPAGKLKLNKIRLMLGDTVELVVPEFGEIYRITYRKK